MGRQLLLRLDQLALDDQQHPLQLLPPASLRPGVRLHAATAAQLPHRQHPAAAAESLKQREIADVQLRQTIASTAPHGANAYWDLAYAIASLQVQQQSLDLARENLRNTRARIEIGTTPPIDEIEPEAEVASRRKRSSPRRAKSQRPRTPCAP